MGWMGVGQKLGGGGAGRKASKNPISGLKSGDAWFMFGIG
jgi:hypothetical protein